MQRPSGCVVMVTEQLLALAVVAATTVSYGEPVLTSSALAIGAGMPRTKIPSARAR